MGRRRARLDQGRFVLEGPAVVAEALTHAPPAGGGTRGAGVVIRELFVDEDLGVDEREALLELAHRRGVPVRRLASGVVQRIADTLSPRGVLAVADRPSLPVTEVLARADARPVVVLVDVADPGNVGTLVRAVEASGAGGLVAAGSSADPFGPKAARASAGSVVRVPVADGVDAADALGLLGDAGYRRLGAVARRGADYDELDLRARVALVLGNEAHGLDGALATHLDAWISIPMDGGIESLNVAVAGAVLCFESARQRRRHPIGRPVADSTR